MLKVKVRVHKGEKPVALHVDALSTVLQLNEIARQNLQLPETAFLSLNGKDILGGHLSSMS